ncbi:MAG: FG-GAP-like repeat-containing protein, partial [Planctomycetota bacterium]
GSIKLNDGTIEPGGSLAIGARGTLTGFGDVLGSVFNAGLIETRPTFGVAGDYAQFSETDPMDTGSLDILLGTAANDPLQVGGAALLAGDLRVEMQPGVTLGPSARRLVTAQLLDAVFDSFDATLVPRVNVLTGPTPEPGIGIVVYGQNPGVGFVELGPQPFTDPPISRSDFPSLGAPADAVIGDVAGSSNGGPDGLPDLLVVYPELPNAPAGGVALFVGEATERGCTFRPIGVYQGKNADRPIAVEIGDFDGNGVPEVAFANGSSSPTSRLVSVLDVDSTSQTPLTDSDLAPLVLPGDRRVTDLAVISLGDTGALRGPPPKSTLLALSGGGVTGSVTAATYSTVDDSWDVCDIDVCDDPDSFDPIDPDGPALLLGEGFVSSSTADDKVVAASNTGGMPETFPKETFAAGADPTEIRAGDLNNDGFPDFAVINETGGTVSVFVNIADAGGPGGRSFAESVEWTLRSAPDDPDPLPGSIALADLDDDGDLDIAVISTDASSERVVRSLTNLFVETASLSFSLAETLPTQPPSTPVLVREFDAEGVGFAINDDLVILTEPDAGSLSASRAMGGPVAENSILCSEADVCLPDVNGDGLLTPADFNAWVAAFNAGLPAADQNGDGLVTPADFNAWVVNYNLGC